MSTMSAGNRTVWVIVAIGGAAVAWAGGFMLSSGNSQCIDGPTVHECSGTFASDGWHGVGVVLIIVGVFMVGAVVAKIVAARRESNALTHR